MVLAHASVYALSGHDVFVLIDESDGRRRANVERKWLKAQNAPGTLTLMSTPQVPQEAAQHPGWIVDGLTWQQVYTKMRSFDDGLPARP